LILIQVVLAKNDVMKISEALKKIHIGGLTVTKKRGRGKNPPPEIHASKGTEIFRPQFSDKYMIEVIVADSKVEDAIKIIKENTKLGKIFTYPVSRAIDIASGDEGDKAI